MLQRDLKLSVRHLWRRRIYTVVIIVSLTIGFTSTNLLVPFLISEIKSDTFHANTDRTFQLFSNDPFGGAGRVGYVPEVTTEYLAGHYPEIEDLCALHNIDGASLATEKGEFSNVMLLSVDSSFFSVFSFPLIEGTDKQALNAEGVLLTREKAEILFGESEALGQTVVIKTPDTTRLVTVSGIIAPGPEKSHLKFDAVIHHSVLKNNGSFGATYLLLKDRLQSENLVSKINADGQCPGLLGIGNMTYSVTPVTESYFDPSNVMPFMKTRSLLFVRVGYVVCALIFFMASFNFINLFLLSLHGRKKEVGIKKTLGVTLRQLIGSSLTDILLYVVFSFALSAVATSLLLSSFNDILGTSMDLKYLLRFDVMAAIGVTVFLLATVTVIVSALRQWSVRPINLMNQALTSHARLNRSFFLIQFVISVTLIISAVTIIRQMDFVEHAPLGFNRNIIQLQSPGSDLSSKLVTLKEKLAALSGVQNVSVCSGNPISGNAIIRYELEGDKFYTPYLFSGDEDFMKTLDLTLLEGDPISPHREGKLVNETFVRFFGLRHPVGEKIPGTEDRIIGVVKDFTCLSFKENIPPAIISFNANAQRMLIDYSGGSASSMVPGIQKSWNEVFPDYPFSYSIIQEDLMKRYNDDAFFYKIMVASSVLSILISCFGLFALSWAVVQGRTKEIGIRKVLGANLEDILQLLTKSFIKRILLAYLISAPIGYILMQRWLDNFVNKIALDVSVFALSGFLILLIAVVTLSFQTIRAALLNPVDELKAE